MTEIVRAQRVRIIREIEASAAHDSTGRLPWRPSWAAYFGDRDGLLEALATRRQCLAFIRVEDLPPGIGTAALARRIRRSDAALERILRRYGQLEAA
ncbi:hypothetical protein [Nocardioides dilutus]